MKYVSITNNFADWGGGGMCCMYDSNPILENVTIANNYAGINQSGAIYCNASNPTLMNSILWNNSPSEIYLAAGGVVTMAYSDIEGGWAGLGNIDNDPLFVDPANGDYHLQLCSPCIDAGNPTFPLDPDGTITDIGAFYYDQSAGITSPENVTIEIIGSSVYLSWDAVAGANSYKVYSSDDPYSGFVEETSVSLTALNEKKIMTVLS